MTFKTNAIGALFVLVFSIIYGGCASAPKVLPPQRPWQKAAMKGYTQKTVDAFGSTFVIRVWPSNKPTVPTDQALNLAVAEIKRISKMADATIPGGEVYQISEKAHEAGVPISAELANILIDCNRMYRMSDFRFDVTFTPFKDKADFTDADFNRITDWDTKEPPTAKAVRLFGDRNMILDTEPSYRVRLYNQRIRVNLKGMIRGYAAERAIRILMKQGLGGIAVMADSFVGAIGTPLKDTNLMCIENPSVLGTCLYKITASVPGKIMFFSTSASTERRGQIFDPKETWMFRSGGVIVAGENGGWVQFASTISAVMDDLVLNPFFAKLKPAKLAGTYFIKGQNAMLDGTLAPYATVTRIK